MQTRLTPRQEECLRLTKWMTDREIAAELGISEPTVKKHVAEACQRLGVNRRKAALAILEETEGETALPSERATGQEAAVPTVEIEPARVPGRFGYLPPPRNPLIRIGIALLLMIVLILTATLLIRAMAESHAHVERIDQAVMPDRD